MPIITSVAVLVVTSSVAVLLVIVGGAHWNTMLPLVYDQVIPTFTLYNRFNRIIDSFNSSTLCHYGNSSDE